MIKTLIITVFLLVTSFCCLISAGEDPKVSKEHLIQGVSLLKNGHLEEAIEEFKKAIELNGQSSAAYYNLGLCYLRLENFKKAVEPFKKYIESHPDSAFAHYNLGCAYSKIGNKIKAQEEYNKALELNPDLANR
ncbi:MAG: tetratricopeptide repeat protein [Candidatus Omnitrophota bacterium]|nr:tetratricopeptide repeat protein [Candidatus Omnitrophota bacterium]